MALPPYVKLEMIRGDGKTLVLTVVDGNGALLDLTGATLWLTMKQVVDSDKTDSAAIIEKTTGAGITLRPQTGVTLGQAEAWLDSDDTDSLPAEKTKLLYDAQYQAVGADPVTLVRGDLTIFPDITRRTTLP